MPRYSYVTSIVFNPETREKAAGQTGQIYAKTDTARATALTALNLAGQATTLTANADALLPTFFVDDHTSVVWKSGSFEIVLVTSDPVPGAQGPTGVGVASAKLVGDKLSLILSNNTETNQVVLPTGPGGSDKGTSDYIKTAGTETNTALRAAFVQERLGNRTVYLGDSVTQGATQNSTNYTDSSFPMFAQMLSQGRVLNVRNAGIGGNKSADALARFDTDVTPYAPGLVVVALGTNDIGTGGTLTDFKANVRAIVAKVRAIRAQTAILSIAPRNDTHKTTVIIWNYWLRDYAARNGFPYIDTYDALVNRTAGGLQASLDSGDGIHPSNAGYLAMGQRVADTLTAHLPPWNPAQAQDNADIGQLFSNNALLMTDANADGVPDDWFAYGGSTGFAHALVTDAQVPGQMMRVTQTANTSQRIIQRSFTRFTPGDVLAVTCTVTSDGGVEAEMMLTFTGATGNVRTRFKGAVTRGVIYQEFVVPMGTTSIMVDLIAGTGTGVVSWGRITPVNLTTAGIP